LPKKQFGSDSDNFTAHLPMMLGRADRRERKTYRWDRPAGKTIPDRR
jgi:hypothetical protein